MKITDEIILKLFLCKNGNVKPNVESKLSKEFKKYLEARYNYFNGDYTFVIIKLKKRCKSLAWTMNLINFYKNINKYDIITLYN